MNWMKSFREEIEKRALIPLATTALTAGLGALELQGNLSASKDMTKLQPLRNDNSYKLPSANQYQFEGGKRMNIRPINQPALS